MLFGLSEKKCDRCGAKPASFRDMEYLCTNCIEEKLLG